MASGSPQKIQTVCENTRTRQKHEGRISWSIDDFLTLANIETQRKSSVMKFRFGKSVYKFQLKLNHQVKDKPDDIGLYLYNLNRSKVNVAFSLRAVDATGAEIRKCEVDGKKINSMWGCGFRAFLSQKELKEKALNKSGECSIKLICDFTIFESFVSEVHPKKQGLFQKFVIACKKKFMLFFKI